MLKQLSFLIYSMVLILSSPAAFGQTPHVLSTPVSLPSSRPDFENEEFSAQNLQANWYVSLGGKRNQDALSNQKTEANFSINLNASYDLTSFLNLKASPRLYFRNGNVQSDSATSGKDNTVELAEASANFHYDEMVQFSLGALNQGRHFSRMFIDDIAFPAANLSLQLGTAGTAEKKESFAALSVQSAIPTSSTLTTNSRDYEKTPTLSMIGTQGQVVWENWSLNPRLNYFEYKNLPSTVASDSGVLGNSVRRLSDDTSSAAEFLYPYQGFEGGLVTRYDATRNLGFHLAGHFSENTAAPKNLAQASTFQLGMDYWMGSLKWTPSFEYFKIAPDAAVAYYNEALYETNRVGYQGGLALQYKKIFVIALKGGERDVVFESATQSREHFYSLALETLHASF